MRGVQGARDPAGRTIKSNTGINGALENYESANMTYDAFGFLDDAALFSFFDVADLFCFQIQPQRYSVVIYYSFYFSYLRS